MPSLLNYIFNRNIARINELKKQAEDLKSRIAYAIYEDISKEQLQIILFDDKEPSELGITPDRTTSLLLDGKSGFNPFYSPVIASQEDSPDEE